MTNTLYNPFKKACLDGNLAFNLFDGPVRASLVDTSGYTFDASHTFITDTATLVANSNPMTAQTCIGGTFDADNITFGSISGNTAEAVIIWLDSGTPSTSRVVAYLDTNITNLPVTPNGSDITLTWNASGIFTL